MVSKKQPGKMDTGTKTLITSTIIAFLALVFLITSCGTRKKQKSHIEELVVTESFEKGFEKSKEENNIKATVEIKTNSITGTKTIKTTYEPIDKEKPATIEKNGQKTNLNNAKLIEEETMTNQNTQTHGKANTTAGTKKEAVKQSEASKKAATKKVDDKLNVQRDRWSWNWSWLLWLILAVWLVWKYGRFPWLEKIKDKIWWI